MKGGKKTPLGYTIIEVMIVLAVSGVIFLIAINFINGKQERTSFTEGLNDTASRIQNVIEQVTDGQYSDILLQCSWNGPGTPTMVSPVVSPSPTQGTNSNCVFLGKLISFTYPAVNQYQVVSMAAGRSDAANGLSPTLANVDPAIISSLTATQTIQQALNLTGMSVTDTTGAKHTNTYYNIGFVQGLGAGDGVGTFKSGAQTISMVYSSLSPVSINNATTTTLVGLTQAEASVICLSDGTQSAQIILGTNNNQLSVNVHRLSPGVPCVP
ncbi:MAG TPA: prepilin-type N-terminal cleavage/methylation domain-containing protein [Candidatus Dormibacteraeota bacterium]|nr:prepilin-type N-terminal cleavage/methylation domain-containing protein [Candidatus Dormibacteraeota bacterium]